MEFFFCFCFFLFFWRFALTGPDCSACWVRAEWAYRVLMCSKEILMFARKKQVVTGGRITRRSDGYWFFFFILDVTNDSSAGETQKTGFQDDGKIMLFAPPEGGALLRWLRFLMEMLRLRLNVSKITAIGQEWDLFFENVMLFCLALASVW